MNLNPLRSSSRRQAVLAGFGALLCLGAGAQTMEPQAGSEPWKSIPIPPLHDFHPVQPVRMTLPNGVQIFLEEDHELPFIYGYTLIRGGSRDVPAAKVGLTSLYGRAWRTSGTAKISGDKLDDELAIKAATVETGSGSNDTYLSWESFSKDFDSVFARAMDLMLHPEFQQVKLDLAKQSAMTTILRRNDEASGIAYREAAEIAYGKDNPYGRQAELATVGAVTLDDLRAWHTKTVVGENLIVGIEGDFDAKAMEAKLRAAFGAIPRGEKLPSPEIHFTPPTPGIYFASKGDVDQSTIVLVGLGTEESNPDYYALSVMNEIFSGGFGSRLVQNVRTKMGLAYSVSGSFGAAYDHPGLFFIDAGTKSESTVPATEAIEAEIRRLRTDPPTDEEMRRAKDAVLNSFIFEYDTPSKILSEQVTLASYGYPADFLEKYHAGIEKVTAADVTRVAMKYVQPEKLATVIVGNDPQITPPLSGLGKVTTLDVTIPGAPKDQ